LLKGNEWGKAVFEEQLGNRIPTINFAQWDERKFFFSFVPGVISYNPGAFLCYVGVTALKLSCEQGKPPEKKLLLETQDIHGVLGLTFGLEQGGIVNTVELQLWRQFSACLKKERPWHHVLPGSRMTSGLERLSSYNPSEHRSRPT